MVEIEVHDLGDNLDKVYNLKISNDDMTFSIDLPLLEANELLEKLQNCINKK